MNLVLLEPHELDGTSARVTDRRARHIALIHRAEPGKVLRVGVVGGAIGTAVVASARPDEVTLENLALAEAAPPPLPCTLVLAIPRPNVLRRVLAGAAAFGIKRVVLFGSLRVEKSYWQSPAAGDTEIHEQFVSGLEQGGDTILPVLEKHRRFRPFVEDHLPAIANGSLALVAHPGASDPCPRADGKTVTLIVGPEGGLVDHEIDMLTSAAFHPVTLGARTLRVEHAVLALLGRLF